MIANELTSRRMLVAGPAWLVRASSVNEVGDCPATRNEVNEVKGILQSKKVWGKFGHFYAKPIEVFSFKPI